MTTGTGSKREKELEAVVDSMKRVVDRLKAENDRLLKKTTTGGGAIGGISDPNEKKLVAEKKRADKLEEVF